MLFLEILFWLALFLLVHTYVFYPLMLHLLGRRKKIPYQENIDGRNLPYVSLLMAAYNEEKVIREKLLSIANNNYPKDLLQVVIGSDNSNDSTNAIVEEMQKDFPWLHFIPYKERQGKIKIINSLIELAHGEILIITDANVIFAENTISELMKGFSHPKVGLVDTRMMHTGIQTDGISFQEHSYIASEVRLKYCEGVVFGTMMGPFGGCYAIRKSLFKKVPEHFLVDDFFINMQVLKQNFWAISHLEAHVYEDVSNNIWQEFRRKKRIAAGNFQNLACFFSSIFTPWKPTSFCFLSHKVLRWIGPFILLLLLFLAIILSGNALVYLILLLSALTTLLLSIIEISLRSMGVHVGFLRFLTHFYFSNAAMLLGFIKFCTGIRSSVWTPTQRFQNQK